ncbi:glutaredoxin-like protein, YruB-family [Geobacter metallireducens RCH3]|uniref:Glutaredoxin family protein n=1 Tax=Geobacter metallireducens (strain ATCC 53774 / DSM 7210 / GS-15) TaxID=269799 RepID=Q39SY6_GEOMG|nr:glutaredoxin domain-containing protein [Geobacter metallireducens]ABB32638.1 glutaredoxin family protein [Geobacter metallireducens GS-15]EHP87869.1 glutaredoxin-like protein, YruB-family [Geobacter metallireducens RCH3]
MKKISALIPLLMLSLAAVSGQAAEAPAAGQSKIDAVATKQQAYPKVVLYSVAWCPHCKEAKEYFTRNNIPFINKDVELDEKAMDELTKTYKSQGVPVIVIGDDKKVLKGFNPELFEKAVKDIQSKK